MEHQSGLFSSSEMSQFINDFRIFSQSLEIPEGVLIAIVLFFMLLSALWILLPFAVWGIKRKMSNMIDQLEQLNDNIQKTVEPNE